MKVAQRISMLVGLSVALLLAVAQGQNAAVVLTGNDLTRVVPSSFYYKGQSPSTQIRNAAAARFGSDRYVIAGMVDTSGYSTEVRATYQGFLITDSKITIGGQDLGVGAYGFGFSNDGKFNVLDLSGATVVSADAATDKDLRRPRPLAMTQTAEGVRLYSGKQYVVIAAK
jgi:hypothetical protein